MHPLVLLVPNIPSGKTNCLIGNIDETKFNLDLAFWQAHLTIGSLTFSRDKMGKTADKKKVQWSPSFLPSHIYKRPLNLRWYDTQDTTFAQNQS